MNLIHYRPMTGIGTLQNHFDRIFSEMFAPTTCRRPLSPAANWHPAVDISEKEGAYLIRAELPGVGKENISVDLDGRTLIVSGTRSDESANTDEETAEAKASACNTFTRSFMLPNDVDAENIDAAYKDGVLTVTVPKSAAETLRQITVH